LLPGKALHFAESPGKLGAGFLKCDFGINAEKTSEVDGNEEDISKFSFYA
jgi:hypothetical protein